ncbi:MAG: HDIG domain-containing protein [Christensenella sp.]|nr:HDIG domain-containing protein [Christensenella sp.]
MTEKGKFYKKGSFNILLALVALGVCIAIALVSITPQTYDIEQGEISPQTITASRDVINEVKTQRKIEEEQAKVGPSYKKDANITQQIVKKLDGDFTAFEQARAEAETFYNKAEQTKADAVQQQIAKIQAENALPENAANPQPAPTAYNKAVFDPATADWKAILTQDQVTSLKEILPDYIDNAEMYQVISMTSAQITAFKEALTTQMQDVLYDGVSSDDIDEKKSTIIEEVSDSIDADEALRALTAAIVSNDLYPNTIFDEVATQAERERVAELVTPEEYKEGQNIVVKGEVVTEEQFETLKALGMLSSESTSAIPYAAIIVYIVLVFVLYAVFLAVFNRRLLKDTKKIAILAILTAAAYGVTALTQLVAIHVFPIFLFVILGAILLSPKNAIIYSVFLSLLLMSVTTGGQELFSETSLMILLISLLGSFFTVYTLKDMRYRSRLVLAGLTAAIPGVVIVVLVWMLQVPLMENQAPNAQQTLNSMMMVVGSGVMCGIISIGVLPLIENAFRLTTPTKLLELSDPTHPLTKRLMLEAPGTYHHSILVANLAEAACNAVGGFSLLARVGAYFHDIGKVNNPMFFKENQRNNVNPHDQLTPEQSAHIIRKHVPDGVAMLKKYNMPGEIIKIVQNHHGNGTVGYFYYEAMKQNPKTNADDFRYDGLPPDTKEGAIVMLADIVEAAVRSLDNPSRQDISEMVYKLIKARYDEGLLDAAPLNRQDLNVIAEAFVNIFDGVYHQRVKYPDIKIHGAEDDNIL